MYNLFLHIVHAIIYSYLYYYRRHYVTRTLLIVTPLVKYVRMYDI